MKIFIDEKNKAVIATGNAYGKKVKAVAISKEDFFDKDFGVELAKKKFRIKEKMANLAKHESLIKEMNDTISWCTKIKKEEESIVRGIKTSIYEKQEACNDFVEKYFTEEK